jgi:exonuclease SbcD
MRIAHLADLHLGKTVNGFSMIEDQKFILNEIFGVLKEEKVDAVLLAGDIYDRNVPSAEATVLLDDFLSSLQKGGYEVFMIAGNHDNGDRVAYGSSLLDHLNIHIAGTYKGVIPSYTMHDAYGAIHVYLLPYVRAVNVNRYIDKESEHAGSCEEAVKKALDTVALNENDRNIILAHQFITGAVYDPENGSEEISLGGLDQVSGHLFDHFDYAALGHIHRPQKLLREEMRYAGTPLKYSFSEAGQTKSIPVIDLKEKGNTEINLIPLIPQHELREIHGMYHDIISSIPNDSTRYDYMHITLNDEEDVPEAIRDLRMLYPNIMKLDYDNTRTRTSSEVTPLKDAEKQSPLDIVTGFYEMRNGKAVNDVQREDLTELIRSIWEGDEEK